jgi:hypothetical protein
MIKDSKSQVDEMTKLRKILDNPADPQTKQLLSPTERAFCSIQKRLLDTNVPYISRFRHTDIALEPTITIRPRMITPVQSIAAPQTIPLPEFTPVENIPEFSLVPQPAQDSPPPQLNLSTSELIEIEKVDMILPQFVEVLSHTAVSLPKETSFRTTEDVSLEEDLPEWQHLPQKPIEDVWTIPEQSLPMNIPESVPNDTSSVQNDEDLPSQGIPEFEVTIKKDDITEEKQTSDTVIEQQIPQSSWRQRREEKKAEKQKQKEAERLKQLNALQAQQPQETIQERCDENAAQNISPDTTPSLQVSMGETPTEPSDVHVDLSAFKGLQTVDEKTAHLLYQHGYFSLDNLKDATIDDLVQIRGIKRKFAKQIKKEVEQKSKIHYESEFIPIKEKILVKPIKQQPSDFSEWEHDSDNQQVTTPSVHNGYTHKG